MTAARARAPKVSDIRWEDTLPDNLDAIIDVAVFAAISDFQRTTRLDDGTRSAQVIAWADEFARIGGAA